MFMNRNGYWMYSGFMPLFAPDDGGAAGGSDSGAAGGNDAGTAGENDSGTGSGNDPDVGKGGKTAEDLQAEIARLNAEIAKQKAALDKATHEASSANKALKAKMTQEEIDAAAKKEADEKAAKELEELRREVAKAKTVKSVMGKLGVNEETAGSLADCLYGAADIDNAMLLIQKEWQARGKALKLEYGKLTGPGAGTDSNSPEAQAIKLAQEIGKARNASNEQAKKALGAYLR